MFFDKLLHRKETRTISVLVDEYFRRVQNGETLDPGTFVTNYPEHAFELTQALNKRLGFRRPTRDGTELITISESEATDRMPNLQGATFGDYEIIAEIGHGAMGVVYRAWEERKQRHVAIKTLHPNREASSRRVRRLEREAIAQSRLNHPNIVQVYDSGVIDDIPYVAMEYVDGGRNLEILMRAEKQQPFDERRVAEMMLILSRALTFSHENGVVHRDIKPANILMAGETPKLTDFGLAFMTVHDLTRLTQSGELLGTLCYMAPESLESKRLGLDDHPHAQADIYSLGATMYEMLTGELAYDADSPGALVKKIVEEDVVSLRQLRPDLSREIEAICIKCLEKSAVKRYYSAADMADDLRRFLDRKKVKAPSIHWPLRRLRKRMTRRRIALLSIVLSVVMATVASVMVREYQYRDRLFHLRENLGYPPEMADDYDLGFLVSALRDDNVDSRTCAITALARQDGAEADAALLAAAVDRDNRVRFHLGTTLLTQPRGINEVVCRTFLADDDAYVVVAGIKLAGKLGKPELTSLLVPHAKDDNVMLRTYATTTVLNLLADDNEAFVAEYLADGHGEARRELMRRFMEMRFSPSIPPLIEVVTASEDPSDVELAVRILDLYSNADCRVDSVCWREWWRENGDGWQARRCKLVTWVHPGSNFRFRDVIWSCNGSYNIDDAAIESGEPREYEIIRDGVLRRAQETVRRETFQNLYIGVVDGTPVGQSSFIDQIRDAVIRDRASK